METIIITGHTRGIGKALYDKFKKEGHNTIGVSASTGFDIGNTIKQQEILEMATECNIFVNNAYHPTGQIELLSSIIEKWKGLDKMIINIGSKGSLIDPDHSLLNNTSFKDYVESKIKQNDLIKKHQRKGFPQILNVLPGVVNTEMALHLNSPKKMNPIDLADLIYSMIKIRNQLSVQGLIVDIPGLDSSTITIQ